MKQTSDTGQLAGKNQTLMSLITSFFSVTLHKVTRTQNRVVNRIY